MSSFDAYRYRDGCGSLARKRTVIQVNIRQAIDEFSIYEFIFYRLIPDEYFW